MWPYWLEECGRAPNTVHNDLAAMDSMYLLTGVLSARVWGERVNRRC